MSRVLYVTAVGCTPFARISSTNASARATSPTRTNPSTIVEYVCALGDTPPSSDILRIQSKASSTRPTRAKPCTSAVYACTVGRAEALSPMPLRNARSAAVKSPHRAYAATRAPCVAEFGRTPASLMARSAVRIPPTSPLRPSGGDEDVVQPGARLRGDAAAVHLPDQSVGAIRRPVRHVRAHRGGVRLRVGCEPVGRQERLPQVDGVGGSIPVGAIPGVFVFCLCLCFRFRRRVVVAGAAASSRELALGERGDEVGEGAKGGFPPRANVRVKGERHLRGPPGPHAVPHERLHRDRRRDDVRVERLAEQGVRLVEHPGGAQRVEEPRDEGGFVAQACAQPSRGGSRGGERARRMALASRRSSVAVVGPAAGVPPEPRGVPEPHHPRPRARSARPSPAARGGTTRRARDRSPPRWRRADRPVSSARRRRRPGPRRWRPAGPPRGEPGRPRARRETSRNPEAAGGNQSARPPGRLARDDRRSPPTPAARGSCDLPDADARAPDPALPPMRPGIHPLPIARAAQLHETHAPATYGGWWRVKGRASHREARIGRKRKNGTEIPGSIPLSFRGFPSQKNSRFDQGP